MKTVGVKDWWWGGGGGGGGGQEEGKDKFFYGLFVRTFFKLYGSLVIEINLITWVVGFHQKIDRYIQLNVPVSIKILNPDLPVFLLLEIIQCMHKLINFCFLCL